MEDFMRELKAGSALFLLYGDTGVGKTRLLQELDQTRLSDTDIHWIDLKTDSGEDNTVTDRSAEVEAIFSAAASGDIIIADHFEEGLKKTRHQLLLSWSTDGIDKQLNLIIASSTEGFNELRQLSQQYQTRVQSFQLMPFKPDEVDAFLGFYLFPDHPIGKLSIAAPLRKPLAATQGIIARIIEIVDRDGTQIKSSPLAETQSIRRGSRIIVTVLVLFALAVGIGWYLASRPGLTPLQSTATIESEPAIIVESAPAPDSQMTTETEITAVAEVETTNQPGSENEPAAETGINIEPEPEIPAADETDVGSESSKAAEPEVEIIAVSEPGTMSDTEAVLSPVIESEQAQENTLTDTDSQVAEQNREPLSNEDRFQRELLVSQEWIKNQEDIVGTIQILILRFDTFDEAVYYDYVANLASRQADVDKLRIFKTYTGNKEVYSVFYGEYDSRQRALKAIGDLPAVLKEASPIPRSIGGLREEIRRLKAEN